jgi:type IV pilus assembly protein PilW
MRFQHDAYKQTGFSLVEIMIALVIGLLTTLVIMQVFAVFEGQKRSTTGSADAQTNGSVALYTISSDLQLAGFGLLPVTNSPLECNPTPTIDTGALAGTATTGINVNLDLTPVIITDGGAGAGASDTISIVYGTNPMGGIPTAISFLGAAVAGGTPATVDSNLGCRVGDIVLASSGAACQATRVTGPTDIAQPPVPTTPDLTHIVLQSATGILAGYNLACLGTWTRITYGVNSGNLEVTGAPIIAGVVNIQAQYGISATANSNQVTAWVNTDAAPWLAPMTVANRNRIKAIRVAVVARNGQFEKTAVTTACSSLTAAAPTGLCAWEGSAASPAPAINLTNDPNWANYRYRVFETIIPLRNVIWAKDTL